MLHSETIGKVAAALVAAQADLKDVTRDKIAKVKTRGGDEYSYDYADLATVLEAVRPVLVKNKLAISQPPASGNGEGDTGVVVETLLLHESGEYIGSKLTMPCDPNSAQSMGSAITYGRRYGLTSLLGIATESDDDGVAAERPAQSQRSAPTPQPGAPICAVHGKPMKHGANGWYCSTPVEKDGAKVTKWCSYKPPQAAPPADTSTPDPSEAPAGAGGSKEVTDALLRLHKGGKTDNAVLIAARKFYADNDMDMSSAPTDYEGVKALPLDLLNAMVDAQ